VKVVALLGKVVGLEQSADCALIVPSDETSHHPGACHLAAAYRLCDGAKTAGAVHFLDAARLRHGEAGMARDGADARAQARPRAASRQLSEPQGGGGRDTRGVRRLRGRRSASRRIWVIPAGPAGAEPVDERCFSGASEGLHAVIVNQTCWPSTDGRRGVGRLSSASVGRIYRRATWTACCTFAAPPFRSPEAGRSVLVSVHGRTARRGVHTDYAATKGAVISSPSRFRGRAAAPDST